MQVYSTQKAFLSEISAGSDYSRFLVSGITGGTYVVVASTNLASWAAISTNITTFTNFDYDFTNFAYRFYRALYKP